MSSGVNMIIALRTVPKKSGSQTIFCRLILGPGSSHEGIWESGLSSTSFGPFLKKLSVDFLRPSEIPPCGLFSTSNSMPRLKSILLVHSQLFALLGKGITSTQPNILRNLYGSFFNHSLNWSSMQ